MELKPIDPIDLTVEELEALARSTEASHDDVRPADLCRAAMLGKSLIWRFTGDDGEFGVIVTQSLKRVGGLELFVEHMGGKGFHKNADFIFETLEKFAREHGFRWMVGLSVRPVAWVLKKRLGFQHKAVLVVKELN